MTPLSALIVLGDAEKRERGLLYTPAEIAQQPATWVATHRLFENRAAHLRSFLAPAVDQKSSIVLVGAGSSDYVGQSLVHLLRSLWKCDVQAIPSTDLLTNPDYLLEGRPYLWISFSRSGDSPEAVAVLEQALASSPNIRHLIVTCNEDAQMIRIADGDPRCTSVVLDDAVNDRSLAMTSSFTNMVVFAQALAHLWTPGVYERSLASMCAAAEYLLDEGAHLAYQLAGDAYRNACYVGAGALHGAARESALKLTELTAGAVPAMSETTLGLRHGPMSSLNSNTLFTILLSGEQNRQHYDADLLSEIRRKQIVPTVVAVGGLQNAADHSLYHPSFDSIPDNLRPPVHVLFGQMVGLFASVQQGLKPDSPSPAGVISRVVERFRIYA